MNVMRIFLAFILVVSSVPVFPQAADVAAVSAAGDANIVPADKESRIVVGDIININVFPAQEFSREVTVQPDGTVEMSLVGSIKVEGLTILELETSLVDKLSKFIANPQVTVNIRRFALHKVSVIGDIHSPGHYDYRAGMKILDLVAVAGGILDNAKLNRVRVLRRNPSSGDKKSFTVNFKAVLDGDLSRDVSLMPGDVVYIPKKRLAKASKWMIDNFMPWATLGTLTISIILVTDRNR